MAGRRAGRQETQQPKEKIHARARRPAYTDAGGDRRHPVAPVGGAGSGDDRHVDTKVTPNKAGTKRKPQGVKLSGKIRWESESGIEPPIVTAFNILISKGGLYNGGKYPKCAQAQVNRKGPGSCPPKSIMGSATGSAYADDVITHPKVTFVNGGAKNICFYTVLTNPARVRTCVPGKVTK